jgi:hypothetical protein
MGSIYGWVQIRGEDLSAVRAVLEELVRKKKGRSLLGPPLGVCIGVYPGDHGRDPRVAHAVAHRLPGELFHLLVHDDIFAYE